MARKLGISYEQVIDAAVEIADQRGLSAATPSTVAAAVGVRTPSLYAHVAGADGLRNGIASRATVRLTAVLESARSERSSPMAALEAICHAYRGFARQHPGLYDALLPAPKPTEDPERAAGAAATVAVIAAPLTALGIESGEHVDLIRTLRALLHGFVDLELRGGFGLDSSIEASFDVAVDLALRTVVAAAR